MLWKFQEQYNLWSLGDFFSCRNIGARYQVLVLEYELYWKAHWLAGGTLDMELESHSSCIVCRGRTPGAWRFCRTLNSCRIIHCQFSTGYTTKKSLLLFAIYSLAVDWT